MVLTVLTHTTTFVVSCKVEGQSSAGYMFIIDTFTGVSVAVASFTFVERFRNSSFPCFLDESWATHFTAVSTSMMLALAFHLVGIFFVRFTGISVSITYTSSSNTDILDTVVVPTSNSGIFFRDGHQMSKQCFGSE
jgi:hypothetical protein